MNAGGLVFMAIGAFALCGAGFDWDWFMSARKARFVVWIFGRNGAGMFYGRLGGGCVVIGLLGLLGVIDMK